MKEKFLAQNYEEWISGKNAKWEWARYWTKKRDNWTCQKCGHRGQVGDYSLHVHHIGDNDNNKAQNLMTFCFLCHPSQRDEEFWKWLKNGKIPYQELFEKIRRIIKNTKYQLK